MLYMNAQRQNKKVFFDLNHPADFHFFKHLISLLKDKGYKVKIVARDKECLQLLLEDAGIEYISRGKGKHTLIGKYLYAAWILVLLLIMLLRFRPDVALSLSSPYLAILTRLLGITCVTYDDTDSNPRLIPLIKKSKYILSPINYPHNFHRGHFRIPTLKELAYLHPSYITHDQERTGVFFRITRTDSIHHSNASRLKLDIVQKKMEQISRDNTVVLSSETSLKLAIDNAIHLADPINIHRDLARSRVFWGNSATMAAEAAVLGIPAIFISAEKFAYIKELETIGLLYYYHPDNMNASLEKLDSILAGDPPYSQFLKSRILLLKEKIDMTSFMDWFIEALPESANIMREEPEYALKFISA